MSECKLFYEKIEKMLNIAELYKKNIIKRNMLTILDLKYLMFSEDLEFS